MAVKSAENTLRKKVRNKKDGTGPVGIKIAETASKGGRSGVRNVAQKPLPGASSWLLAIQRENSQGCSFTQMFSPSCPTPRAQKPTAKPKLETIQL